MTPMWFGTSKPNNTKSYSTCQVAAFMVLWPAVVKHTQAVVLLSPSARKGTQVSLQKPTLSLANYKGSQVSVQTRAGRLQGVGHKCQTHLLRHDQLYRVGDRC